MPEDPTHHDPRCKDWPNLAYSVDDDTADHHKARYTKPRYTKPRKTKQGDDTGTITVQQTFLNHLSCSGNITASAQMAGRPRQYFYRCQQRDPAFAQAWAHALEEAADRLELEAVRRAVEGVETAQFYRGEQIGTIRHYSDALLMFLLKARRPDRFGTGISACMDDAKKNDQLEEVRREIERKLVAAGEVASASASTTPGDPKADAGGTQSGGADLSSV